MEMNLEDRMPSEISQTQKDKTVQFHSEETPGTDKALSNAARQKLGQGGLGVGAPFSGNKIQCGVIITHGVSVPDATEHALRNS